MKFAEEYSGKFSCFGACWRVSSCLNSARFSTCAGSLQTLRVLCRLVSFTAPGSGSLSLSLSLSLSALLCSHTYQLHHVLYIIFSVLSLTYIQRSLLLNKKYQRLHKFYKKTKPQNSLIHNVPLHTDNGVIT
jgi:hypothetical protein